jgi:predicted aconitase with swiveling domain
MILLRGRGIVGGTVEAPALVTHDAISGFGGIDVATGTIIEPRHELFGVCFTGKVLVFPGAKGSSGWSGFFQSTRLMGTAPAALVFSVMTTKAALGAIVTRVPAVVGAAPDPVDVLRTGDLVRVDGDAGTVELLDRAGAAEEGGHALPLTGKQGGVSADR